MSPIQPQVLLVDDRLDKLLAMEAALGQLQVTILKAHSGREALAICEKNEFAVIILDVNMPIMDGFQTAQQIRGLSRCSRTPIIFLSAANTQELIARGYELGAVDYIPHIDPLILRAKVSVFEDLFRQRMELLQRDEVEAELRKAKAAAEQANAAKDRFIAALSHELRTPLTPVVAILPTLLESVPLPDDVKADLRMIHRSVQLEAHLINDLLDITSITRGRFPMNLQQADVHRIAMHALRFVAPDAKAKNISVHVELNSGQHQVWADPTRLQQVCWNLLKNAIRYTPEGGEVWIRSRNKDGAVHIEVADSGIGFTPEQAARLFDAFERPADEEEKFKFGGLGLGLYISRAILEQHGSELRADSAGKGKGATFAFSLGTLPQPAEPVEIEPVRKDEAMGPLRLLLVEDDENTRNVLMRLLVRRGHLVHAADTVHHALKLAAEHHFDLIISDLGLPDGSGLDLMPVLRDQYGLHGIAVTGYGMEYDAERSRSAGFSAHLIKPVDFSILERTVRQLVSSLQT
jgi:signal transduction histidine kinase